MQNHGWIRKLLTMSVLLFAFIVNSFAIDVALTIDDLPLVGKSRNSDNRLAREARRFRLILATLQEFHVPAAGFVVPGMVERDQWKLIAEFRDHGHIIANHTFSHKSLNWVSAEKYIANIEKADKALQPYFGNVKYFRYPYLAGGGVSEKHRRVSAYLTQQGYIVVPVTIDSHDFRFNQRYQSLGKANRKANRLRIGRQYVNYVWSRAKKSARKAMKKEHRPIKEILLIHMNAINAYYLGDIIEVFRKHGYHFISLPEALKDPVYTKYTNPTRTFS